MLTPDPGGGFPTRKSPGMYRRLVLYGIIGMAGKLAAPEYTDLGEWRCRDTACFFFGVWIRFVGLQWHDI
jgi:hypothetical protein